MLFNGFLQLHVFPISDLLERLHIGPESSNPVLPNNLGDVLHDGAVMVAYIHDFIILVVHFEWGHFAKFWYDDVVHCCGGGSCWGLAAIGVVSRGCCRGVDGGLAR